MTDNITKRYANKNENSGAEDFKGSNFQIDSEELENKLRHAGETARDFYNDVKETVGRNYDRAESAIKTYPVLSAAAAFVAGIAIAKILGRD